MVIPRRVNQQVQNYKTCLKNSHFGVEKFNFFSWSFVQILLYGHNSLVRIVIKRILFRYILPD